MPVRFAYKIERNAVVANKNSNGTSWGKRCWTLLKSRPSKEEFVYAFRQKYLSWHMHQTINGHKMTTLQSLGFRPASQGSCPNWSPVSISSSTKLAPQMFKSFNTSYNFRQYFRCLSWTLQEHLERQSCIKSKPTTIKMSGVMHRKKWVRASDLFHSALARMHALCPILWPRKIFALGGCGTRSNKTVMQVRRSY